MLRALGMLLAVALLAPSAAEAADVLHEPGDWSVGLRGGSLLGAAGTLYLTPRFALDLSAGRLAVPSRDGAAAAVQADALYAPPMLGHGSHNLWGWQVGGSVAAGVGSMGFVPGIGGVVGLQVRRTRGWPLDATLAWRPMVQVLEEAGAASLLGFGGSLRWSFRRPSARTVPRADPPRLR